MFQDLLTELRQFAGRLPLKVLILGTVSPEQRVQVLQEFRAGCGGGDMYHPQRNMGFKLPNVSTGIIVVIDEVADVSADDQHTLLHWLEQHRDGMVLSFAKKPIFPFVKQGTFLDRLYYCLNVMTLNVNDAGWPPSARSYPRAVPKKPLTGPAR